MKKSAKKTPKKKAKASLPGKINERLNNAIKKLKKAKNKIKVTNVIAKKKKDSKSSKKTDKKQEKSVKKKVAKKESKKKADTKDKKSSPRKKSPRKPKPKESKKVNKKFKTMKTQKTDLSADKKQPPSKKTVTQTKKKKKKLVKSKSHIIKVNDKDELVIVEFQSEENESIEEEEEEKQQPKNKYIKHKDHSKEGEEDLEVINLDSQASENQERSQLLSNQEDTEEADENVGKMLNAMVAVGKAKKTMKDKIEEKRRIEEMLAQSEKLIWRAHGKEHTFAECSLYLFTQKSTLRKKCVWLVTWPAFEHFLTTCILINAINISTNDYEFRITGKKNTGQFYVIKAQVDFIITLFFMFEFVCKVIAMGFLFGHGTYIKDGWNKLDFVVVITGLLSMFNLQKISAIRTFRLLRPLRSINKVEGIRILVNSILLSIPQIANVAAFLMFIITLLGIFGLHLFTGMFEHRCRITEEPYKNLDGLWEWPVLPDHLHLCNVLQNNCPAGSFCGAPFLNDDMKGQDFDETEFNIYPEFNYGITNFDNIGYAVLSVFQSLTGEGWSELMYILWKSYSTLLVGGFFIFLVFFGCFFVLNLFLAVISNNFEKETQKLKNSKKKILQQIFGKPKRRQVPVSEEDEEEGKSAEEIKVSNQPESEDEDSVGDLPLKSYKDQNLLIIKKGKKGKIQDDSIQQIELMGQEEKDISDKDKEEGIVEIDLADEEGQQNRSQSQQESQTGRSKKLQMNVINIMFSHAKPKVKKPKRSLRQVLQDVIKSPVFISVSFTMILSNTVVLAMDNYKQLPSRELFLQKLNLYFTVIFAFEMVFKIFAFGLLGYVRDTFNIFDGVLVIISLAGIAVEQIGGGASGVNVITVFRSLRVLRIFKLASRSESLLVLLEAIRQTVKEIMNYLLLLFLYIFIMALLGMELYAYQVRIDGNGDPAADFFAEDSVPPQQNFDTFPQAMLAVFCLLVNEDWHQVLYQYKRSSSMFKAFGYLGVVVIIGNFLLLQLFLALLIQNFSNASKQVMDEQKALKRHANIVKLKKLLKLNPDNNNAKIKLDKLNINKHRKKQSEYPFLYEFMKFRKQAFFTEKEVVVVKEEIKLEGKSLYLFSEHSLIRKYAYTIAHHNIFEAFIILCIVISTTSLANQSPLEDPKSSKKQKWQQVDLVTTVVFTYESAQKIIAVGFLFCGKNSYMRNVANIFDFIIVCSALAGLLQGDGASKALGALKVLRIARIARPLRIISRSQGLKIAINSLVISFPQMVNLAFFCFLIFFLFGIFGVNYFKGAFYHCDMLHVDENQKEIIETMRDCMDYGGDWIINDSNFDDIFQAMSTMFKVAQTEGWLQIMQEGVDARVEMVPKTNNNQIWSVYFSLFIILGCFFVLNLFDGIVIQNYNDECDRVKIGIPNITSSQNLWITLQQKAGDQLPEQEEKKPEVKWKLKIYNIVTGTFFEYFILGIILTNLVVFMLNTHRQKQSTTDIFNFINQIFMYVFIVEAIMKLSCMGLSYFNDSWNIFDISLLCISLGSLAMKSLNMSSGVGNKASLLRIFRLGRLLRLIHRAKNLKTIFDTFLITLPSLANIGLLLGLVIFIYMILGIEVYSYTKYGDNVNEDANFRDIKSAFFTLFRVSTGEGWNFIMDDLVRTQTPNFLCYDIADYYDYQKYKHIGGCGKGHAYPYMISFQMVFGIIFLNLFVAVILDGFDESQMFQEYNLSSSDIHRIKDGWLEFDKDAQGLIKVEKLEKFLGKIPKCSKKKPINIVLDMMLPVIRVGTDADFKYFQDYYLFQDVMCAYTHLQTQMTQEVEETELKDLNLDNKIINKVNEFRKVQVEKVLKLHPHIKQLELSSAHIAFVTIITEMYFKTHPLKKLAYLKRKKRLRREPGDVKKKQEAKKPTKIKRKKKKSSDRQKKKKSKDKKFIDKSSKDKKSNKKTNKKTKASTNKSNKKKKLQNVLKKLGNVSKLQPKKKIKKTLVVKKMK